MKLNPKTTSIPPAGKTASTSSNELLDPSDSPRSFALTFTPPRQVEQRLESPPAISLREALKNLNENQTIDNHTFQNVLLPAFTDLGEHEKFLVVSRANREQLTYLPQPELLELRHEYLTKKSAR